MKTKYLKISSLLLLLFIFSFSSCSKEEESFESIKGTMIAELKNDEPIIIAEKADLIQKFEELAKIDGIHVTYEHLEIKKIEGEGYAIFAFSKDNLIKSASLLDVKDDGLYISTMGNGTVTCTTTGCSSTTGCLPIRATLTVLGEEIKVWICTECSADCTRSASVGL